MATPSQSMLRDQRTGVVCSFRGGTSSTAGEVDVNKGKSQMEIYPERKRRHTNCDNGLYHWPVSLDLHVGHTISGRTRTCFHNKLIS